MQSGRQAIVESETWLYAAGILFNMTQAFLVFQGQRMVDPALEPVELKDVWFADANSPLARQAQKLSEDGSVALAILEYQGDVLKFWAFQAGVLQVQYDSSPSFATCTITPPEGDKLEALAELFAVPDQSKAIVQLLSRKRGYGFINERDRLKQLLGLLGLEE